MSEHQTRPLATMMDTPATTTAQQQHSSIRLLKLVSLSSVQILWLVVAGTSGFIVSLVALILPLHVLSNQRAPTRTGASTPRQRPTSKVGSRSPSSVSASASASATGKSHLDTLTAQGSSSEPSSCASSVLETVSAEAASSSGSSASQLVNAQTSAMGGMTSKIGNSTVDACNNKSKTGKACKKCPLCKRLAALKSTKRKSSPSSSSTVFEKQDLDDAAVVTQSNTLQLGQSVVSKNGSSSSNSNSSGVARTSLDYTVSILTLGIVPLHRKISDPSGSSNNGNSRGSTSTSITPEVLASEIEQDGETTTTTTVETARFADETARSADASNEGVELTSHKAIPPSSRSNSGFRLSRLFSHSHSQSSSASTMASTSIASPAALVSFPSSDTANIDLPAYETNLPSRPTAVSSSRRLSTRIVEGFRSSSASRRAVSETDAQVLASTASASVVDEPISQRNSINELPQTPRIGSSASSHGRSASTSTPPPGLSFSSSSSTSSSSSMAGTTTPKASKNAAAASSPLRRSFFGSSSPIRNSPSSVKPPAPRRAASESYSQVQSYFSLVSHSRKARSSAKTHDSDGKVAGVEGIQHAGDGGHAHTTQPLQRPQRMNRHMTMSAMRAGHTPSQTTPTTTITTAGSMQQQHPKAPSISRSLSDSSTASSSSGLSSTGSSSGAVSLSSMHQVALASAIVAPSSLLSAASNGAAGTGGIVPDKKIKNYHPFSHVDYRRSTLDLSGKSELSLALHFGDLEPVV